MFVAHSFVPVTAVSDGRGQEPFQAWELDANLDGSSLQVIPVLRRLTVIQPESSLKKKCNGPVTFGGINDEFVFGVTEGKV